MLTVICVEIILQLLLLVASSVGDLWSAMEVKDCVANPDARVALLQRRIQSAGSHAEKEKLERELYEHMQTREAVRASVIQVIQKATDSKEQALHVQSAKSTDITNPKMYREVVEYYKVKCFNWHEPKYEFALQFMHLFANLCREQTSLERIKTAIDDVSESLKREDVS
ncbi:hypothetical protein MATL_G00192940 [Megalops atlanticus]|uniref:Legumain prodomain domain-containing protein n=1 Tax=Megalops atlanticus TaxID=7932 RepID=A0A9D3T0P7_MEGAT|nr:hypothetical protein MATL_G00192940 [Megalops atlanticus]